MAKKKILLIVHPDSACGSADFNLGRENAEYQRLEMQCLIQDWEGHIMVMEGGAADELSGFRRAWKQLGEAINQALEVANAQGYIARRITAEDGSDYPQQVAIHDLVKEFGLSPGNAEFTLTGAWIDNDGGGCVNSVKDELEPLGYTVEVQDAINLDFEFDHEDKEDEELEQEEPVRSSPSRGPRP